MRKLTGVLVAVGLAVTLGGCVVFVGPITGVQQDVIGKLRLTFTICASGFDDGGGSGEDHPGCPDEGNGSPADNDTFQILLAFRVPAGTGTPDTLTADPEPSPPAGGPGTFSRSPGYSAELQRVLPAPAGFVWVGYISAPYAHDNGADDVPAQFAQVTADFDLPRPANGGPFAGPFRIRPVVGFRGDGTGVPFSRSVSCGDFAFGGDSATTCIDSPTPALTVTDLEFATRDLGILGGSATANPGQTVQLPFDANLNGTLPAGTTFSVSAATNLPGVTVAPKPDVVHAGGQRQHPDQRAGRDPERRKVPGTFDVSVTARLPNGQSRTGVSKLTVRDRQKPVARGLSIRPRTIRPQAPSVAAPARVSYRLSEPATMRFRVQRCRRVKRKTRCRTLKGGFSHAGKAGTNRFRFTGFLRNRALRPGRYRLVGTPTDLAKNKGKSVRASFRIKR